jgi:predicted transcriptional regulator
VPGKAKIGKTAKSKSPRSVRASVSLRSELYRTLEALARQKKVSTAWVLREAAEQYAADQWPLLANSDGSERGDRS